VSNFPLAYKLSWLPRLLKPSLRGAKGGLLPAGASLLHKPAARTARLVFLGDISAVANRGIPEIDQGLRALIASADLVIGNCESPVVERARHRLATRAGTRHAMPPRFLAEVLAAIGAAPGRLLLSLANNHILDQGVAGYEETKSALAGLGIGMIGDSEEQPVRTVDLKGLSLGFAAFTEWRNASAADFAGRATTLDRMVENDCAALRYSKPDHLCVVAHWDREFRHFPRRSTRELAEDFAEAGAALIVGHHAHVLQPAEMVADTMVAYGLGDFLGTALPRVRWPLRLGAILVADISIDERTKGRVAAYRMMPFARERAGRHERLVPLEDVEGEVGELLRRRFAELFPAGDNNAVPK
jgi:poly-gamma-glutamate capsule biosynthesis protein CapA/YwtB (metallophosphatase superfamily)